MELHVQPERIRLGADGRARLRVRGHGYGLLRCGPVRRWVFGPFALAFEVDVRGTAVTVSLRGLTGREQVSIPCAGAIQLKAPPSPLASTRTAAARRPRLQGLYTTTRKRWQPPAAPRLARLERATIEAAASRLVPIQKREEH